MILPVDLTRFFDDLLSDGIRFVVLRNYEGLPAHPSKDVDIEVLDAHYQRFLNHLNRFAQESSLRLYRFVYRPSVTMFKYFRPVEKGVQHLQIDVGHSGIVWHGVKLFGNEEVCEHSQPYRNFFIPSDHYRDLIKILQSLVAAKRVPVEYIAKYRDDLLKNELQIRKFIERRYPLVNASKFAHDVVQLNGKGLLSQVWRLRLSVIISSLRNSGIDTLRGCLNSIMAELRFYLKKPGLFIVLIGPDGVGKTTLAGKLFEQLRSVFKEIRYFHWIPTPLWRLEDTVSPGLKVVKPKSSQAGNLQKILSPLRLMRNWLRAHVAFLLTLTPALFRDRLIIGDRYIYSYYLDPGSVKYFALPSLARFAIASISHPNIVFVLAANSAVIRSRKNELEDEQICGIYERLRRINELIRGATVVEVRADGTVDQSVAQIAAGIFAYLRKRDIQGK